MSRRLASDLLVAVVAGALVGGAWCWRQARAAGVTPDSWTLAADALLDAPLADRDLAGPRRDVLAALPVDYEPTPDSLGRAPHDDDVTLHLRRGTLRQALDALDGHDVAWWYDPDARRIAVGTWQNQDPPVVERVYFVGDLLDRGLDLAGRFRRVGSQFSPDPWTLWGQQYELRDLLRCNIDGRGWTWGDRNGVGGVDFGSIGFAGGHMTVRQTPDRQRHVELLLAALRATENHKDDEEDDYAPR